MICDINDNIALQKINNLLAQKKLPHAIMIEEGSLESRVSFAEYIAAYSNCEGENKPCFECNQCRMIEANSNPDVIFVAPEEDKKFISVAQIRKLRADAFVLAHFDVTRFFIIKNAELINEQGQNALLKILEEPPEGVVFILLTPSRTMQLETIVSRCSVIKLKKQENDSEQDEELKEEAKKLLEYIFDSDEYKALVLLKKYEKDRKKAERLIKVLQEVCVFEISDNKISLYRQKILNNIYNDCFEFADLLKTNVNTALLFSSAVCRFSTYI